MPMQELTKPVDDGHHALRHVLAVEEGALLVVARAQTTPAAGEGHKELAAAPRAPRAGEALFEIAAGEEFSYLDRGVL